MKTSIFYHLKFKYISYEKNNEFNNTNRLIIACYKEKRCFKKLWTKQSLKIE